MLVFGNGLRVGWAGQLKPTPDDEVVVGTWHQVFHDSCGTETCDAWPPVTMER
jgi:hypothetical protein